MYKNLLCEDFQPFETKKTLKPLNKKDTQTQTSHLKSLRTTQIIKFYAFSSLLFYDFISYSSLKLNKLKIFVHIFIVNENVKSNLLEEKENEKEPANFMSKRKQIIYS